MSKENSNPITPNEENDALLPDGYAEGDDFFDVSSWSGDASQADASDEAPAKEEAEPGEDFTLEQFLTNETLGEDDGDAGNTDETATTTGDTEEDKPRKLKFGAQIDHAFQDVELDESELPTLYQKAHVTDRVQAKLAKISPVYEKSERLAKVLGYGSVDEMLEAAAKSYEDSEVERLTTENVHPEVARDMVTRKLHERAEAQEAAQQEPEEEAQPTPPSRDFKAEVSELLRAFPKLRGQNLPDEVVQACLKDGTPLVQAYASYKEKQDEAEKTALRKEKATLKHNADAAARAPVRGVSKGGPTDTKPEDPFLKGFNSDGWR